jgi:hypothetical protein
LFGGDELASEQHLRCKRAADRADQALCAATRRQAADARFGQAKFCAGGRDADVAGERHFEAAADCMAVQRSDYRLAEGIERRRQARAIDNRGCGCA